MKYNEHAGVFTIFADGTLYHMTVTFVEDCLNTAGCSIHCMKPFQIIDKVGFLKTEAESIQIARDLVMNRIHANTIDIDIDQLSLNF